jgi:hypothetical protein
MGRFVCHYEGLFFEWSTICDAPVTKAMTREEFEEYYLDRYGSSSKDDMRMRMEIAVNQSTSSMRGDTLEELVSCNRAGPNEERLTFEEVIKHIKLQG